MVMLLQNNLIHTACLQTHSPDIKSQYRRLPSSSLTSFGATSISFTKSVFFSWFFNTTCGSQYQTSYMACFHGVVSPSAISPSNETLNECQGASPSSIWSIVSYRCRLLINGRSWSSGRVDAQIWRSSLILPTDTCSFRKIRSASSNEARLANGE